MERDPIHITFIIVYYCDCSIIIVVNFLLCLIYKLNFMIGIGKSMVYVGFDIISSLRHSLRVLKGIHLRWRGTTVYFCETLFHNKHLVILASHFLLFSSHNWMYFHWMYTHLQLKIFQSVEMKLTSLLHKILFYCFPKSCSLQQF